MKRIVTLACMVCLLFGTFSCSDPNSDVFDAEDKLLENTGGESDGGYQDNKP